MKIALQVTVGPDGQHTLGIRVRTDEGDGQVLSPWDQAFMREHTVILEPPQGGARMSPKTIKRRSSRQERLRIEAVGGRRHAGSGALPGHKSDGSLGRLWRMENKFTTAQSYRVDLRDLNKIRSECVAGQAPVFNVEFQNKHTGQVLETWVLVPASAWEKLVNANRDDSGS